MPGRTPLESGVDLIGFPDVVATGALVPSAFWRLGWIVVLLAILLAATVCILWRIRTGVLRMRTEQLQAEVFERTEDLRRANERLQDANSTREKFFSIIAHDLRSPVTGMSALMSRVEHEFPHLEHGELNDLVRVVAASARGIESMLENLLEWSRLQLGELELGPQQLTVDDVVPAVIDAFRGAAHGKAIELVHEPTPGLQVSADPHGLKTILANLISNAVKFTPGGGTVTVSSRPRQSGEGSRTVITVRDTGIGISEADLAVVFDLGRTGRPVGTAGERGSGLGLTLCRELVERLEGSIAIESEVGIGTTASIDLPAPDHDC
jgi:two-component system, sensor histidine kinase and response regulator